MLYLKVLIREFVSIDRDTSGTVSSGEVSSLGHESINDSMEVAVLVGVFLWIVSNAERPEVLSCLGNLVLVELHR